MVKQGKRGKQVKQRGKSSKKPLVKGKGSAKKRVSKRRSSKGKKTPMAFGREETEINMLLTDKDNRDEWIKTHSNEDLKAKLVSVLTNRFNNALNTYPDNDKNRLINLAEENSVVSNIIDKVLANKRNSTLSELVTEAIRDTEYYDDY